MTSSVEVSSNPRLLAALTIGVALLTMAIKYLAYLATGSVALYSDALESIVNVVTAITALIAIKISQTPPDHEHPFGHHKAELFSAIIEGALILVAALMILQEAVAALRAPHAIEQPALGLAINGVATAINAGWALILIRRGGVLKSAALTADGWHLMTDVMTSVGVLVGLALVFLTGWQILDPLLAAAVALNILWTGYKIMRQSASRLLDEAASPEVQAQIRALLAENGDGALQAHDIRTRDAGGAVFIEFHLVVPGSMSVSEAHRICDRLEDAIEARIAGAEVMIHVEPEEKAKQKGAVALAHAASARSAKS